MKRWLQDWISREDAHRATADAVHKRRRRTMVSLIAVVLVAAVTPVAGVSDNTNLMQQILTIVQNIQSVIVGTDVSVASLQSQINAIKAKTDNLPADTNGTLNEMKASIGLGPLTQFVTTSRLYNYNPAGPYSLLCSSTGPFLLHLHVAGDGFVDVWKNDAFVFGQHTNSHDAADLEFGANMQDTIKISAVAEQTGIRLISVLITMQTTEGAVVQCNDI